MKTTIQETIEIRKLADKISDMTECNDHTGARLELAIALGGNFVKLMQAVAVIHNVEGHIPYPLLQYREELTNRMLQSAKAKWGEYAGTLIKSSF